MANKLFYIPDGSLLSGKKDLAAETDLNVITQSWNLSETFKNDNNSLGTLLSNELPWQNKWYLKFAPPKSPQELHIDQYWSYESPKLETFVERGGPDSQTLWDEAINASVKTSKSTLKTIATCILLGNVQDTLREDSYPMGTDKKSRDKDATSILSMRMKMPVNESGQTKRSILESLTILAKPKTPNPNLKKKS